MTVNDYEAIITGNTDKLEEMMLIIKKASNVQDTMSVADLFETFHIDTDILSPEFYDADSHHISLLSFLFISDKTTAEMTAYQAYRSFIQDCWMDEGTLVIQYGGVDEMNFFTSLKEHSSVISKIDLHLADEYGDDYDDFEDYDDDCLCCNDTNHYVFPDFVHDHDHDSQNEDVSLSDAQEVLDYLNRHKCICRNIDKIIIGAAVEKMAEKYKMTPDEKVTVFDITEKAISENDNAEINEFTVAKISILLLRGKDPEFKKLVEEDDPWELMQYIEYMTSYISRYRHR